MESKSGNGCLGSTNTGFHKLVGNETGLFGKFGCRKERHKGEPKINVVKCKVLHLD